MPSKDFAATTASYVELSNQSYNAFVEAFASFNKSALEYSKSVWQIASRPYSTAALEAAVQDNFERASKLVSLTVAELESNGQKAAELAEKFAAQAARFQESYTTSLKGAVDMGLSNLNYVKDTATQQIEDLGKRVEHLQRSALSAN
jgi:hypothetical protein